MHTLRKEISLQKSSSSGQAIKTGEIKYKDYLAQQHNEFNEYILTKENFYAAKEKFASIYLSRQDLNQ
jgi:hypothetical protein